MLIVISKITQLGKFLNNNTKTKIYLKDRTIIHKLSFFSWRIRLPLKAMETSHSLSLYFSVYQVYKTDTKSKC